MKAQIAANQRGIVLVNELINEFGLDVVIAYMMHVQNNAEIAVREMLRKVAAETKARTGSVELCATDYMDDGTPISLKVHDDRSHSSLMCSQVSIDEEQGSAHFDFTGSSACDCYR